VTDDEDHNVSGKVVSAVMVQFFAAHRAMTDDFQEPAEQSAGSTIRAPHRKSPPQGFGG
jgi:hypothetical protein